MANRGASPSAMRLDADGKIVVTGSSTSGRMAGLLGRFLTNGKPDETFGIGGFVAVNLPGQDSTSGIAVAVNEAGKIRIAAGGTAEGVTNSTAVVAFRDDGRLESGFGDGGIDLYGMSGANLNPAAIILQSDGGAVVAGEVDIPGRGRTLFLLRTGP